MLKISVNTLHAVANYGSALQTYATQYIFNSMGLNAEIVNYRRNAILSETVWRILHNSEYSALLKLKLVLIQPSSKKARAVFDSFLKNNIKMTDRLYVKDEDFIEHPIEADIYCTGSDQVWNTGWHKEIPAPFFLSYAPEGKKRIAFSASFGKDLLDEWEKPGILEFLKKYSAISVRERSAVDIINALGGGVKAEHVLDPTLTVEPEVWFKLAVQDRIVKEKYILVYQLNNNKAFDRYAKRLAAKKKLKLIRLCTRYDQLRKTGHGIVLPKVEEFLSLIRDAEYVVTDSFHGTAFCLTFHKRFIDIYPELYSTRLESILELTKLKDRKLEDYTGFSLIDKPIDYVAVDRIMKKEREHTLRFLEEAIHS